MNEQLAQFLIFLRGYEYYPQLDSWAFYDEKKDKFKYYKEKELIAMFIKGIKR